MVLKYRYINNLRFEEIAEIIGYDISWIFKLHKKGLIEFEQRNANRL